MFFRFVTREQSIHQAHQRLERCVCKRRLDFFTSTADCFEIDDLSDGEGEGRKGGAWMKLEQQLEKSPDVGRGKIGSESLTGRLLSK